MPLRIGKDGFTLPIELVTSTQAILARKRSGKSYTASVQAEELLRYKQQIATIDPTGAWWGLRSSAAAMDRVTRSSSSAATTPTLHSNLMRAGCWRRLWSSMASRRSSMQA